MQIKLEGYYISGGSWSKPKIKARKRCDWKRMSCLLRQKQCLTEDSYIDRKTLLNTSFRYLVEFETKEAGRMSPAGSSVEYAKGRTNFRCPPLNKPNESIQLNYMTFSYTLCRPDLNTVSDNFCSMNIEYVLHCFKLYLTAVLYIYVTNIIFVFKITFRLRISYRSWVQFPGLHRHFFQITFVSMPF